MTVFVFGRYFTKYPNLNSAPHKLYSQEALPVWAAEADAEVRPILRQQPQILNHHWEQPSGTGDGDGGGGDGDSDEVDDSHPTNIDNNFWLFFCRSLKFSPS